MSRYISILPSNICSTDDAGYSQGTPLLQFSIGAQKNFLIGPTVRLNGTYTRDGASKADSMREPSLGIYNLLDQLVISSNKTNQTYKKLQSVFSNLPSKHFVRR